MVYPNDHEAIHHLSYAKSGAWRGCERRACFHLQICVLLSLWVVVIKEVRVGRDETIIRRVCFLAAESEPNDSRNSWAIASEGQAIVRGLQLTSPTRYFLQPLIGQYNPFRPPLDSVYRTSLQDANPGARLLV
jgi:hypothetical protein